MAIAFHLRHREAVGPCEAWYVDTLDPQRLAQCLAELRPATPPLIFPLAEGFLVLAQDATTQRVSGAMPLRRIVENLYIPWDADLVPTLHPEEAAALVRERGLVILPHQRVFGYSPNRVLPLTHLVDVTAQQHHDWQAFDARPPFAEQLRRIERLFPPTSPEQVFDDPSLGRSQDEPPSPQLEQAPAKTRWLSKAMLRFGQGMRTLGQSLGWGKLEKLGSQWMAQALAMAPQLSEAVLGKQEAALRQLLKWFQEGKIDEALRRALPMGNAHQRGGPAHRGTQLPQHDPRYSLADLLRHGHGPASVWMGGLDVQAELARTYRRVAQEAEQRGDFRRAAFIYGKLLVDFRAAAEVLARGGLHRDAAIVFRDKLHEPLRAAVEFEKAGDFAEALRLYREQNDFVAVGDLLMRLGEIDAAQQAYRQAADRVIRSHRNYHEAGMLIWRKTQRDDWAIEYFRAGWEARKQIFALAQIGDAMTCGQALAERYAANHRGEELLQLLTEIEQHLEQYDLSQPAQRFFNALRTWADRPGLACYSEELRDRARLGLARRLGQYARTHSALGTIVSDTFGQNSSWSAEVVSDATYAMRAAMKIQPSERESPPPAPLTWLGRGRVTAAVSAWETGDLVVGFDTGEVVCYRVQTNEVVSVVRPSEHRAIVVGLSVDPYATLVVVTTASLSLHLLIIQVFTRSGDGRYVMIHSYDRFSDEVNPLCHLSPRIWTTELPKGISPPWVWMDEADVAIFPASIPGLQPGPLVLSREDRSIPPVDQLLLALPEPHSSAQDAAEGYWIITTDGLWSVRAHSPIYKLLSWPTPIVPMPQAPVRWCSLSPQSHLLVGITPTNTLAVVEISSAHASAAAQWKACTYSEADTHGFCAAWIARPWEVMAMTADNRLCVYRFGDRRRMRRVGDQKIPIPNRLITGFYAPTTREILLLTEDGGLMRMPM